MEKLLWLLKLNYGAINLALQFQMINLNFENIHQNVFLWHLKITKNGQTQATKTTLHLNLLHQQRLNCETKSI